MKRNILLRCLIFIFFILCIYHLNIYAENYLPPIMEVTHIPCEAKIITMKDVYDLNNEYQKNGNINEEELLEKSSVRVMNRGFGYFVADENGKISYFCGSYSKGSTVREHYVLQNLFTGAIFELSVEEARLKKYLEMESEENNEIWENVLYVYQQIEDSDYGGIYYDRKDRSLHVYTVNQELNQELEERGIICEKAVYSREDLYEKMRELWMKRDKYRINYIGINEAENTLDIYVDDMEQFYKNADNTDNMYVMEYQMLYPGKIYEIMKQEGQADIDNPDTFIEVVKTEDYDPEEKESWDILKNALIELKTEYPDYDCRNLYIRIANDGDFERYINFDRELQEFVSMLPEYVPNEKDPVEEMMFGDPERIELKSQLREYKIQYPDMDYKEIYEKYLYDWEECSQKSREEKQFLLNLTRSSKITEKDGLNPTRNKSENIIQPVVIAGSSILILGCIGIRFFKCRNRKD